MSALLKALITLVSSLPEILRFLQNLEKTIAAEKKKKKVKDDIKKINEAFDKGDAKLLNDVFANRVHKLDA